MKISIIGCGYVGIVTGVCLADSGHKIFFFDENQKKLNNFKIRNNIIFEKNLKKKLISAKKNIFFCKNLDDAVNKSDVTFVCVGTPLKKKNIELKYIKSVTKQISEKIKQKKKYSIIYKSTIPPLTIEKICIPILRKKLGNKIDKNINIIFNPEFLREGNAIYDFENPNRIVIGIRNFKSKIILNKIYEKYKKNQN
jgi:UDPglucose 6-dehydrogenase